ncbi:GlcG/HbpS family heme-binding protein [Aneurinibacillus terranovensis]|uniref:GlcG/HbpS family heme-binding protein n=1 Tax=Aneurinibacillus terranovensis TaxID=278991 RepID=UPI0003F63064|nr:heme-binding protein [Aneurinibacillus terranovensis]
MNVFYEKPVITQQIVMNMLNAACQKAEDLGVRVNVSIVDDGGNLKGFIRMDGAPLLSLEISRNKAYTASAFGISTSEWYPMIQNEPSLLHGIVHTRRLTIFGGGVPMYIDDHLVGGIGVSGGSEEEDILCAETALTVLTEMLNRQ